MKLSELLTRAPGIACAAAIACLLTGCGSSDTASTSTSGTSSGGQTPAIQGVSTPSSVSVVTAN